MRRYLPIVAACDGKDGALVLLEISILETGVELARGAFLRRTVSSSLVRCAIGRVLAG